MTIGPSRKRPLPRPGTGQLGQQPSDHDEICTPLIPCHDTLEPFAEATGIPAQCEPRLSRAGAVALLRRRRPGTAKGVPLPKTRFADLWREHAAQRIWPAGQAPGLRRGIPTHWYLFVALPGLVQSLFLRCIEECSSRHQNYTSSWSLHSENRRIQGAFFVSYSALQCLETAGLSW